MPSSSRFTLAFATLTLSLGLFGAPAAQAQAGVPTQEAQAFLGSWALAIDAQGQTLNIDLDVVDSSGSVAAEVSSQMGSSRISTISKNGEKLVLGYSMEAQGQVIPVVMTLTPTDTGLTAELDFASGMFVAAGKGTKK